MNATAADLLFRLGLHGVAVTPNNGQLRVRAAAGLPAELRDALQAGREALVALFEQLPLFATPTASLGARLADTAGIVLADGTVALDRERMLAAIERFTAAATAQASGALALDMSRGADSLLALIAAVDAGRLVLPRFGAGPQADLFAPIDLAGSGGVVLEGTHFAVEDLVDWCRQHVRPTGRVAHVCHAADHPRGLLEALAALCWGAPLSLGASLALPDPIAHVAAASAADLAPLHAALSPDAVAAVLDTAWLDAAAQAFLAAAPEGAVTRTLVLPELQCDLAVEVRTATGTRRWDAVPLRVLDAADHAAAIGAFGRLHAGPPATALAARLGRDGLLAPGEPLVDCGLVARRLDDQRLVLQPTADVVLLEGRRVRLGALAGTAERLPHVRSAHACLRRTADGRERVVLYVAPSSELALDQLDEVIRTELVARQQDGAPLSIAPVTTIPYGSDGLPDAAVLAEVPVIEPDLVARWRDAALAVADAADVGVVAVSDPAFAGLPYRIDDLLPPLSPAATGGLTIPAGRDRPAPQLSLAGGMLLDRPEGCPATLPGLLRAAARRGTGAIRLIDADGAETQLSYAALLDLSERRATGLAAAGIAAGDHVVLQAAGIGDLLGGYWACFMRGAVPYALDPIVEADPAHGAALLSMCERMDARAVLCSASVAPSLTGLFARAGVPAPAIVVLDTLAAVEADPAALVEPAEDATAVLFSTSGTSGRPKLVPQPHRNLVSYALAAGRWLGLGRGDVSFNWMPLDHVGGLSMFHLRDTLAGIDQIHCDKRHVLAQPLRWIDRLSDDRVTVSWAPNFAFDLLSNALVAAGDMRPAWDLSCVRHIMNGGEMISRVAACAFTRLLGSSGLRSDVIRPIWGMSETCSAVTIDLRFDADLAGSGPVVVGPPLAGTTVRIAAEDGTPCPIGDVGALEVRGATVTPGYYRDEAENAAAFTADGWFRTGDLGTMDADGRLTITGRSGNTIVINGINRSCQEIEEAIERATGIASGLVGVCAAPAPDGSGERVTVFVDEGADGADDVALAMRIAQAGEALIAATGLVAEQVIPLPRGEFTKTSLGKLQRNRLAKRLKAGEYDAERLRAERLGSGGARVVPNWFYERRWLAAHPPARVRARLRA